MTELRMDQEEGGEPPLVGWTSFQGDDKRRFFWLVRSRRDGFHVIIVETETMTAWGFVGDAVSVLGSVEGRITVLPLHVVQHALVKCLEEGLYCVSARHQMTWRVLAPHSRELQLTLLVSERIRHVTYRFIMHETRLEPQDAQLVQTAALQRDLDELKAQLRDLSDVPDKSLTTDSDSWLSWIASLVLAVVLILALLGMPPAPAEPSVAIYTLYTRGGSRLTSQKVEWTSELCNDNAYLKAGGHIQVRNPGVYQVNVALRHSNCRSHLAYDVMVDDHVVAQAYGYSCGPYAEGITSTATKTLAMTNTTRLSVVYRGSGSVYEKGSYLELVHLQ
ncbi:hypothetical protein Poli38472_013660 [Pythium oligandrum]|uniref:Uncharacterized protein n=1 Tax=Pythium oligandrum TaxID=41045 RepID=A0A8K1CFF4_PYTOL|nr:hypothetical protein Poli38472_013660 [Pythium oligandrum]|eukprot:TMW61197.1 hypothetical protein Poli38472_013660 [Pythium oligandrum]